MRQHGITPGDMLRRRLPCSPDMFGHQGAIQHGQQPVPLKPRPIVFVVDASTRRPTPHELILLFAPRHAVALLEFKPKVACRLPTIRPLHSRRDQYLAVDVVDLAAGEQRHRMEDEGVLVRGVVLDGVGLHGDEGAVEAAEVRVRAGGLGGRPVGDVARMHVREGVVREEGRFRIVPRQGGRVGGGGRGASVSCDGPERCAFGNVGPGEGIFFFWYFGGEGRETGVGGMDGTSGKRGSLALGGAEVLAHEVVGDKDAGLVVAVERKVDVREIFREQVLHTAFIKVHPRRD